MKIRNEIEKQLIRDIKYELNEMDIDGMVKRIIENKKVKKVIEQMVYEKISQIIQEHAFMKIQKAMPTIDSVVNEKVKEFLHSLGAKG